MTDNEIIELYFARSDRALIETSEKYSNYCTSIARNILQNQEDVDECFNDMLLNTQNSIPPNRPETLKAYLGKIIRNLALNKYAHDHAQKRCNGNTEEIIDEIADFLSGKQDLQPEQAMNTKELIACINAFLQTQKKENRMIFVRRYQYMNDIKSIALIYGFTESKVKMSLQRMRIRLMMYLKEEGFNV